MSKSGKSTIGQSGEYFSGLYVIRNSENWGAVCYLSKEFGWVDDIRKADMYDPITAKEALEALPSVYGSYGQKISTQELSIPPDDFIALIGALNTSIAE